MRDRFTMLLGKLVRTLARLRGGGSALPGLVVEKCDPGFLARTLSRLPEGVIVVSGTNGKTTTSKIVVELLESSGLRVFTNRTGSNFSRGVIASILQSANLRGELPADVAVLELDEAHAVHFVAQVPPRFSLLLNVLRDQLDRFGEIDTTAQLLSQIAQATTEGLVTNREDPLVRAIGDAQASRLRVVFFGLTAPLRALFPSDAELHGAGPGDEGEVSMAASDDVMPVADVILSKVDGNEATFEADGETYPAHLALEGVYNSFNAAAALALVRLVLGPRAQMKPLVSTLETIRPAFGRGEKLELDGHPLELVLVKNPAGFRLALHSFSPQSAATMIAINDRDADGRDMSWLWDVSFESLRETGVDTVAGLRAWDMALRLELDLVPFREVTEALDEALNDFRRHTQGVPRRIFCTYTAMLALRKQLARVTEVENVW